MAGFLIGKELDIIGGAMENAKRPFVAVLGGAKVSDKIGVISNLIEKVDIIIVGGAMAYTFLKAQGKEIGDSRFEADKLDLANELLTKAKSKNVKVLLPVDNMAADKFAADANAKVLKEILM